MKYYQEYDNAEKTQIWTGHILAFDEKTSIAYALLDDETQTCGLDRGVGPYHISLYCTKIPERQARVICPKLFTYLEEEGIIERSTHA